MGVHRPRRGADRRRAAADAREARRRRAAHHRLPDGGQRVPRGHRVRRDRRRHRRVHGPPRDAAGSTSARAWSSRACWRSRTAGRGWSTRGSSSRSRGCGGLRLEHPAIPDPRFGHDDGSAGPDRPRSSSAADSRTPGARRGRPRSPRPTRAAGASRASGASRDDRRSASSSPHSVFVSRTSVALADDPPLREVDLERPRSWKRGGVARSRSSVRRSSARIRASSSSIPNGFVR